MSCHGVFDQCEFSIHIFKPDVSIPESVESLNFCQSIQHGGGSIELGRRHSQGRRGRADGRKHIVFYEVELKTELVNVGLVVHGSLINIVTLLELTYFASEEP